MSPEVQGVAGASALEAMEDVQLEVGGEAAAGVGGRGVQGTGPAVLVGARAGGVAAEQLEDGGHVKGGADGVEVDGRGSDSWLARRGVVLGLA